ncbi:hypothetical protein [Paenibacillus sp. GCM10027626]|uniref:hypothetical protein n=1 Tax=Paenibacillus sp. GCM10027626 TaxID=3273411 RepID=UPI00362BC413
MRVKKVMLMASLLFVLGTSIVFASSVSNKILLYISGEKNQITGYTIDGETYIPVKELGSLVNGIVNWDETNKKIEIVKPNIHMILFQDPKGGENFAVGKVQQGGEFPLNLLVQVDNLVKKIHSLNIELEDPKGNTKKLNEYVLSNSDLKIVDNGSFVYALAFKQKFIHSGIYTIKFYIKPSKEGEYQLLSQKTIVSQ